MNNRKQKIKELVGSFHSLKRMMTIRAPLDMKIFRITPSQWNALMIIEQREESAIKDVAKALSITSSATTQLIDGLVTSGYVTRKEQATDRRKVVLTLSNKTKKQVEKMKNQGIEQFLEFFKVLNDNEFNQYILLNKKIVERFLKK